MLRQSCGGLTIGGANRSRGSKERRSRKKKTLIFNRENRENKDEAWKSQQKFEGSDLKRGPDGDHTTHHQNHLSLEGQMKSASQHERWICPKQLAIEPVR
jgi:hypothetical protein